MRQFFRKLNVWPSLLLGIGMFFIGLTTLNYMVNSWWPFDVARLDLIRATVLDRAEATTLLEAANWEIITVFLATILLTITGLVLPLAFFLNKRFGPTLTPRFMVILRQSVWVGLWVAFCVWLQMNRSLGVAVAALVAAVLIMFEALLQVRTRATSIGTG